jgi:hypothetical protein
MGAHLADVYVLVNGTPRIATCSLANARDLKGLAAWPRQTANLNPDARDALEFAKLTGKRWKFYVASGRASSSLPEAQSAIRREPAAELAFVVVLKAAWAPRRILGMALFRRSWCNNLIIDFIASHPENWSDAGHEIRGVLRAIFSGIAHVALALKCNRIWGEATDSSSSKYQHTFHLDSVDDLFIIQQRQWRRFLRELERIRH